MKATVKVVGMKAGGREHIVAYVDEGDPVWLRPEPDNPHDRNAIAVHTAPRDALDGPISGPDGEAMLSDGDRRLLMDRQAGYVPRDVAARFAGRLSPDGILGAVHRLRFHDGEVAGFDVVADWPS